MDFERSLGVNLENYAASPAEAWSCVVNCFVSRDLFWQLWARVF